MKAGELQMDENLKGLMWVRSVAIIASLLHIPLAK